MTAGPILIWGAGAIGGTLGAYWARAGLPVLMVDIEAAHVEACRTTGLSISGPVEQFRQVVPAGESYLVLESNHHRFALPELERAERRADCR